MRCVHDKPDLFVDKEENPMDVLGIGTNMVKALRYWLQAVGLTIEPNKGKRTQSFTPLGQLIFDHDTYIEELGTLHLLQYRLASQAEEATAWYYFFNEFSMSEFSREDFVEGLQKYIKMNESDSDVAIRSLNDDFACIVNTYLPRYREGSNQQKNYSDALAVIEWYDANRLLSDLSSIEAVVESMREITALEMPFSRMSELADLVFKASEIQKQILQKKLEATKKQLERDLSTIRKELRQAQEVLSSDERKARLQATAAELEAQYETWLNSLTVNTENMDSYITASANAVQSFRDLIAQVLNERDVPHVHSRQVSIANLVSVISIRLTHKIVLVRLDFLYQ